jgi:RNA polymerase sigma factor (sigma-70 family)
MSDMMESSIEDLLRQLTPQVLGAVARRTGDFDAAEDAVQEALLAAALQWPETSIPANPRGWLITVAVRRMSDQWRSDQARRRREMTAAELTPPADFLAPAADERPVEEDDTLTLLFLCCHPALSTASQLALTLRAVGGLSTAEIALAFFVPEATMAQRISRAKQKIKSSGIPFVMPEAAVQPDRLRVVEHVLYLIFNEGYTAASGPELQRVELTTEAIRLTRELHRLLPDDGEVAGLLALMLLTDARRLARSGAEGVLIPLGEQDRSAWNLPLIEEGIALISATLQRAPIGPYQLQAAIAAIHAEAVDAESTDWRQILILYELLERMSPNPMVTLNRAVAVAMVHGPRAGLDLLGTIDADGRLEGHHRLDAVRAHLLEMAGDTDAARACFEKAAHRTSSLPERRYLEERAKFLTRS